MFQNCSVIDKSSFISSLFQTSSCHPPLLRRWAGLPPLLIQSSSSPQALGGGYLHFGHMEMMRLTINRRMDPRTTFARWRINAPYKPITRKGLGQRMGGGKGNIDHYVTPVKYGRMIVEVGGRLELGEVEPILKEVAKKLPFPAKVSSPLGTLKGLIKGPHLGVVLANHSSSCSSKCRDMLGEKLVPY